MKELIFFILIILPISLLGQELYFEKGDSLTIIAKSGLTLREQASTQAQKKMKIAFGEKIKVIERVNHYERIDNRFGHWIKVNYQNNFGYLFSGYLTNLEIPILSEDELDCFRYHYFLKIISLNTDSLVYSGKRRIKHFGKGGRYISFEIYKNGTIISFENGYEYEDVIIETFDVTMNDILNLLEYYISKISKCKNNKSNTNNYKISIKMRGDGVIQKIECHQLRFSAINTLNKIVITSNIWDI